MIEPPNDPTSGARPATQPRDEPPPTPPRELESERGLCRSFSTKSGDWLARPAGKGAGGTGSYGLAMIEAVHFFRATEPDTPVYEALIAAGRFCTLFDSELRELLASARPIVAADPARVPKDGRDRRRPLAD